MKKLTNIFYILIIIFVMISLVPKEMQNDTFFTIAIGENVLKNGLTDKEVLTFHENLKFPHSGVFDIILTTIYNKFDLFGIYCFVLIISISQGLLYYYVLLKITHKKEFSFFMTIISMSFLSIAFTARAQIISNFLLLLEFYCLENIKLFKNTKKVYFVILIIIPIIFSNIHSSTFPIYLIMFLPYIAEFFINKIFSMKSKDNKFIFETENIKVLSVLFIYGIIAGFITPNATTPYTDMFKVMNGISSTFISEMKPLSIFDNMYFATILIGTIAILIFSKQKIRISDGLFILGFGILAMSTNRTIYYFIIIGGICFSRIFVEFLDGYEFNLSFIKPKVKYTFFCILIIFAVTFLANKFFENMTKEFIPYDLYPIKVCDYILDNYDLEDMRIYNHFNYGSYLEYRGIKSFIDSRSGVFTKEFNPGCTILEDWLDTYQLLVNYNDTFDKYKITHVLLFSNEQMVNYIKYDSKWECVYQDNGFLLFERKN